jgi:hypothetical protein
MARIASIHAHVMARPGQGRQLAEKANLQPERLTRLAGQNEVGRTEHFIVYSDGSSNGDATARAVLQHAEADFAAIQTWFGGLALPPGHDGDDQTVVRTALPLEVAMDASAGGAYHYACDGTDFFLEPTPAIGPGLNVAELVEVFEAGQGRGWDCGHTNGEGLSRVLAFERYPSMVPDFINTVQNWWSNGYGDYVNDNSATDQDESGNGCATLFLDYLHFQLSFTWEQIVAAAGSSLGATYQQLTGQDPKAGFQDFIDRVATLDDGSGNLRLPANGNPFPIGAKTTPRPPTGGGISSPLGIILLIVGIIVVIAIIYFLVNGGHF